MEDDKASNNDNSEDDFSEMDQENQMEAEDDGTNNNETENSVCQSEPAKSEDFLTLQKLPESESKFLKYRCKENSNTSDKDSSDSSEHKSAGKVMLNKKYHLRSPKKSLKKHLSLLPDYSDTNEKVSSFILKNKSSLETIDEQQEKIEIIGQISKIRLKNEPCESSTSSENNFENLRDSLDEINVSDCSYTQENKQLSNIENLSSGSVKTSDHHDDTLKPVIEKKENSRRTRECSLLQYPGTKSHSIHPEPSVSNFYATEKDKRVENLSPNSPDSGVCETKFLNSWELPSTSTDAKELKNSSTDSSQEEKFNSLKSQVIHNKLSRSQECPNSHGFRRSLPNHYNKRTRKTFQKLNSSDSGTSSDDAKDIPRKKGTRKKRKSVPFCKFDSSTSSSILQRSKSQENVSDDSHMSCMNNSPENLENLKENDSSKNALRPLEIINSENRQSSRKRCVSSNESENIEKRDDHSKKIKLKYCSSSE